VNIKPLLLPLVRSGSTHRKAFASFVDLYVTLISNSESYFYCSGKFIVNLEPISGDGDD
jgi:hypothetical protein